MKSFFAARMSSTVLVSAVLVALSFFILSNQIALAQTAQTDEPLQSKPQPFDSTVGIELPSVAINELLMNEYKYSPGETLTVTMFIENVMSSPTEFRYKTRILPIEGKYISSNSAPQVVLSASPFSERLVLRPNETRQIEIKYTVPTYVKGNVLLVVGAVNGAGVPIGSKSLHLTDRTIPRVLPNKNIKPTSASTSTLTVRKTNPIDITKIIFTQGDISFEPLGGSSGYLLKENTDLTIKVRVEGRTTEDAFILATISNVHSSSTFDSVYQYIDTKLNAPEVALTIKHESLQTGQYQIEIKPISKDKKQLGPSRMITIGVEGITGIVQALEVRGDLPVKKGAKIRVLANWIPIVQLSKEMREGSNADTDAELNTPFTAKISVTNEKGETVASTTLVGVTPDINVVLSAQTRAQSLNAYIEILVGKKVLATYSKEVLLPPLEKSKNTHSVWDYLAYTLIALGGAGVLYILVKALLKFFKNRKNIATGALIFALSLGSIPSFASAGWNQFATTSFDHLYPKSIEATATTWAPFTPASNAWYGVTPYSKSCTRRTATTGANSNEIVQSLPNISGDNKMYRWENNWYKPLLANTDWYTVYNASQPSGWATKSKYVVLPGIFSSSGFIHEQYLSKYAAETDDITNYPTASYPDSGYSIWNGYRPFRASSTNGMGLNLQSALATTTYTNLIQWLNARYNALEFNVNANVSGGAPYAASNPDAKIEGLVDGAHAAYPANSPHGYYSKLGDDRTSTLEMERKTVLDEETGTTSPYIISLRAGDYGTNDGAYNPTDYNYIADIVNIPETDIPFLNSRPGTYRLFNFLYTFRDEVNGSTTASNYYDCYSGNMKVSDNTYSIVPNSYIDIVMFYDENENGIQDVGEKPVSTQGTSGYRDNVYGTYIDGGQYMWDLGGTNCSVPDHQSYSTFHSTSSRLHVSDTNPIAVISNQHDSNFAAFDSARRPSAYVKTSAQVANPVFFPADHTSSYPGMDAVYDIRFDYSEKHLPNAWATGSGIAHQSFYNSTGQLITLTRDSVCGQTIVTNVGGAFHSDTPDDSGLSDTPGDTLEENYNTEVVLKPVPSTIANASTAYWKIPINVQLTNQYKVGTNEEKLPDGWSATTPEQTINLWSIPGYLLGGKHYPVYLGVKYEANGVCGTATTAGLTAPTTNLCNAGTASAVVENIDNQTYDWSCSGIGSGGVDAVCEKPKCPGTQYFCDETNACVADEESCVVDAVCGSATIGPSTTETEPVIPMANLCAEGELSGVVAGENQPVSYFSWLCAGSYGGTSASCEQTKCGGGKVFCQYDSEGNEVNNCQDNCDVQVTTIFDTSLVPKIVRDPTLQCNFSWSVNASSTNPISCTLDGTALSDDPEIVNRSRLINVGRHALECSNLSGTSVQSTTTRCQLTPNYKEI